MRKKRSYDTVATAVAGNNRNTGWLRLGLGLACLGNDLSSDEG